MRITLTIKKFYFDQIKNGVKKIEYRQISKYYEKKFNKKPKEILFHYQSKERLLVEIKKIKIVDNFLEKKDRPIFLSTDKIYAIHVKFKQLFFKS